MKFLLLYLLVAVLGTLGVYYGTLPLWQAMGLTPAAATTSRPASIDPYVHPATSAETPPAPAATAASAPRPQPLQPRPHERMLLPHVHGTDGFFIARWRRRLPAAP